ncbi:fungal-specific transcription factor domain-containing protein [Lipomyces starkeyi]
MPTQGSMAEPHDQPTPSSTADVSKPDYSYTKNSFSTVPHPAASPANATLTYVATGKDTKTLQSSPSADTSNAMSSEPSTRPDNHDVLQPPSTLTATTDKATSDAAASEAVPSAAPPHPQSSAAPQMMHSQRACTQCQRHKIKCVSDGSGPCIRCRKKGFLCHIAPRKKRASKKHRDASSAVQSLAASVRAGRDFAYDAESDDDEIMDDSDSHNTRPQLASCSGSTIGESSCDGGFSGPANGNININPAYSGNANESAVRDGNIPLAGSRSVNGINKTLWLSPEAMASTPSRLLPHHVSRLPEYMKQSTISSCEDYSVYLSLSFVCPELFRRTVDMDWHQNPVIFAQSLNTYRPLFRSLVDSPTAPVYALAVQNDPAQTARYNLPCSPEDMQTVADWRKQYGDLLIDVYFNLINPTQPIIHRRHFMAAYDANKESVILLLAIFAVSVPYCTLGTPEDRRTLQTKFTQHLLGHYSYKLLMPTLDAVQALSLIADSSADRAVLMPHAAVVAAAVELRLHMDCSEWDIPGWERALRKALWWSICIRDAWTIMRFVGTPKVMSEYYDTPMPTTVELSQLTMHESDDLSLASCAVIVNRSRINVSMESCLRSFISVAKLSEILLEVNRSLYQLKGLRLIHQQPAAAASHIAESLESRLHVLAASWSREESAQGYELMEPDLYRELMLHFVRLCIYSQFLPHKQVNIRADRFLMDFYTRFLDATQGCIDTLNKFKNVKFSNYWPPWLNHLVIMHMFVLYDVLIAAISRYFKTHGVPKGRRTDPVPHADEPTPHEKQIPMLRAQRRALLLEILNKDRFSGRVLQYSTELMVIIGDLAASWDQSRDIYKMMLKTTRSFGLADVIDAPGMAQFVQQYAVDAAKSGQQQPVEQQQRAPQQQSPPTQYPTPQLSASQPVPLNAQQQQSPSLQTQSHPLQPQPSQAGTSSQTLLPPVYQLPTVGPLQNNFNPSLQSLLVSPAQQHRQSAHLHQSGHHQPQSYGIAQILNQEQPEAQQPHQQLRYDNSNSEVSQRQPSTTLSTQQQQPAFAGPFDGRMQHNLYEEAAGLINASHANSGVQNVPVAGDNVALVGGSQAIGAFDDFFTNLSINLFEGLADFHRDFIL